MKANELRIGNLVNTPNQNQNPFRVDYFDELKVYMKTGTYNAGAFGDIPFHPLTWDISQLSPIPLTPEVLEKCGAIKYEFDNGKHDQYRIKDRLIVVRNNVFVDYGSDTKLYNLHQLQNFIYALTGKELTYTP